MIEPVRVERAGWQSVKGGMDNESWPGSCCGQDGTRLVVSEAGRKIATSITEFFPDTEIWGVTVPIVTDRVQLGLKHRIPVRGLISRISGDCRSETQTEGVDTC